MSFTASLDDIVAENFNGLLARAPHWPRYRLGELAAIKNGAPLPSSGFNNATGIPVVRIRNVLDGQTETLFEGPVEDSWFIEHGDLLIGMDGDFNAARWNGPRALLNQRVCMVSPKDERVSVQFLSLVLPGYLAAVNKHTPSITVKHLSSRTVADLPIPVPPPREQAALVAAIETHLSRLDAAVASLTRAKANVKRARASVLKAAVEGRLVPTEAALARAQGRAYEPASVLLDRILAERKATLGASGARGKYKEPVKPVTKGLSVLPEGWCWASMDALAQVVGGVTKDSKQTAGRLVPYLRVANVQRGRLDLSEVKTIVAPEAKIEALRLQPGDVLLNEGGDRDKLGRGWVWRGEIAECIHQNHVFRARLWLAAFDSRYISHYANTEGDQYFQKEGKQTTNLASISLSKVKALPVALPPRSEIDRVLAEVDRRLSVLDALDTTLDTNLARCIRLRQAVLKRAFEGRLVPAKAPAGARHRASVPQMPLFAQDARR